MSHGFPRPLNNAIAVGGADFITLPYGRRSQGTRRKAKVKTFLPLSWGSAAVGATLVVARGWAATRAAPTQNNGPTHSFWIDTVLLLRLSRSLCSSAASLPKNAAAIQQWQIGSCYALIAAEGGPAWRRCKTTRRSM